MNTANTDEMLQLAIKARFKKNVSVYKSVTLEDSVFCGPPTAFSNENNARTEIAKMD